MSKVLTDRLPFTPEALEQFNALLQAAIEAAPTDQLRLEVAKVKFDANKQFDEARRGV